MTTTEARPRSAFRQIEVPRPGAGGGAENERAAGRGRDARQRAGNADRNRLLDERAIGREQIYRFGRRHDDERRAPHGPGERRRAFGDGRGVEPYAVAGLRNPGAAGGEPFRRRGGVDSVPGEQPFAARDAPVETEPVGVIEQNAGGDKQQHKGRGRESEAAMPDQDEAPEAARAAVHGPSITVRWR